MKTSLSNAVSIAIVTVLIFVGMALGISGGYSTGPNQYVSCGFTGWIHLHRYMYDWSVESVSIAALAGELGLAGLAAWLLDRALQGFRRRG